MHYCSVKGVALEVFLRLHYLYVFLRQGDLRQGFVNAATPQLDLSQVRDATVSIMILDQWHIRIDISKKEG